MFVVNHIKHKHIYTSWNADKSGSVSDPVPGFLLLRHQWKSRECPASATFLHPAHCIDLREEEHVEIPFNPFHPGTIWWHHFLSLVQETTCSRTPWRISCSHFHLGRKCCREKDVSVSKFEPIGSFHILSIGAAIPLLATRGWHQEKAWG